MSSRSLMDFMRSESQRNLTNQSNHSSSSRKERKALFTSEYLYHCPASPSKLLPIEFDEMSRDSRFKDDFSTSTHGGSKQSVCGGSQQSDVQGAKSDLGKRALSSPRKAAATSPVRKKGKTKMATPKQAPPQSPFSKTKLGKLLMKHGLTIDLTSNDSNTPKTPKLPKKKGVDAPKSPKNIQGTPFSPKKSLQAQLSPAKCTKRPVGARPLSPRKSRAPLSPRKSASAPVARRMSQSSSLSAPMSPRKSASAPVARRMSQSSSFKTPSKVLHVKNQAQIEQCLRKMRCARPTKIPSVSSLNKRRQEQESVESEDECGTIIPGAYLSPGRQSPRKCFDKQIAVASLPPAPLSPKGAGGRKAPRGRTIMRSSSSSSQDSLLDKFQLSRSLSGNISNCSLESLFGAHKSNHSREEPLFGDQTGQEETLVKSVQEEHTPTVDRMPVDEEPTETEEEEEEEEVQVVEKKEETLSDHIEQGIARPEPSEADADDSLLLEIESHYSDCEEETERDDTEFDDESKIQYTTEVEEYETESESETETENHDELPLESLLSKVEEEPSDAEDDDADALSPDGHEPRLQMIERMKALEKSFSDVLGRLNGAAERIKVFEDGADDMATDYSSDGSLTVSSLAVEERRLSSKSKGGKSKRSSKKSSKDKKKSSKEKYKSSKEKSKSSKEKSSRDQSKTRKSSKDKSKRRGSSKSSFANSSLTRDDSTRTYDSFACE